MGKIQVFLADGNRLFREGIRHILTSRNMEVTGESCSIKEASTILNLTGNTVNLLICDPAGDVEQEFETLALLTGEYPDMRVILLTSNATLGCFEKAINAGVSGFLPKNTSAEALHYSLELALLGERIFPALRSLLKRADAVLPEARQLSGEYSGQLSPRENQILGCLVGGQPNKMIARNLNITEATVKVHMKSLLRKINVHNRTEAAIWGMARRTRSYSAGADLPAACE